MPIAEHDGFLAQQILDESVPAQPAAAPITQGQDALPVLSNFEWATAGGKNRRIGVSMPTLVQEFLSETGGWPKRVGSLLFCEGPDHQPVFLESPQQLFAWVSDQAFVEWAKGPGLVPQEQFHAYLRMHAEGYDAVETVPHFPPRPRTYYMHPPLPETDGSYLNHLVGRFNPHTPRDGNLIMAYVVSLFFGGPPGTRPAWLVTGPPGDPQGGRGVGKSKVIELPSRLVGGAVEISPHEDIIAVKKRLLSPEGMRARVARLDNVKSLRFSWDDLEGLITAPVISGHRLYQGEARRPNTLLWGITLNGASLSKDMAQRCMIVVVNRPQYSPTWEAELREFIDTNRWQIINDVRLFLGG
jgi:hypothetical protein